MQKISDYPDEPKYRIKGVSQKTGVQPVTIRAWERRYHILNPQRSDNSYRMYSERDIALLGWLKKQVDSGTTISSAVAELNINIRKGIWPEAVVTAAPPIPSMRSSLSPSDFANRLYQALVSHHEPAASQVFEDLLASYSLSTIFESVITPVLVEIGEAWYNGKILIATEHFASAFFRAKIMAIFQSLPTLRPQALLMVGGGPGELHEIGALMISVLLRETGYNVEYLGPDLPLDDLVLYANDEHPKMIILSATLKESIADLARFERMLESIKPRPIFGFGGSAFNRHPEWIAQTPGVFLGDSLSSSIQTVQKVFNKI